jgi:tetratricopeptide (TPR) repeat protein
MDPTGTGAFASPIDGWPCHFEHEKVQGHANREGLIMSDSDLEDVIPDFGPSKYERGLAIYDERLRRDPSDATAYQSRGGWHHWHEEFEKALSDYDKAIQINPGLASAYCSRASLRATCPDERFRDRQQSLEDARKAMRLAQEAGVFIGDWRQRLCLQVLAAARAENGEFKEAVAAQTEALELAVTQSARSRITAILNEYRVGKPHRDKGGLDCMGF